MSYGLDYSLAAQASSSDRAAFIRRTYAHLAVAILAFAGLETVLLQVVDHKAVLSLFLGGRFTWLLVLGAFMVAGWVAQMWAQSETSRGLQYMGLGLYVVAEAVIFLPLLIIANDYFPLQPGQRIGVIGTAGILTVAVFAGLTLAVFVTKKDYSPLRPILCVGALIALGVIVVATVCGFSLGLFFSFAMVALMSGYILYYTSQVMLHYRTDQHVAAPLALFASIATLFWWILQIVMSLSSRD
jgi:FtsH-binding integral membrane protein